MRSSGSSGLIPKIDEVFGLGFEVASPIRFFTLFIHWIVFTYPNNLGISMLTGRIRLFVGLPEDDKIIRSVPRSRLS